MRTRLKELRRLYRQLAWETELAKGNTLDAALAELEVTTLRHKISCLTDDCLAHLARKKRA